MHTSTRNLPFVNRTRSLLFEAAGIPNEYTSYNSKSQNSASDGTNDDSDGGCFLGGGFAQQDISSIATNHIEYIKT